MDTGLNARVVATWSDTEEVYLDAEKSIEIGDNTMDKALEARLSPAEALPQVADGNMVE